MRMFCLVFCLSLALISAAQTSTTVDPAGNTVVIVTTTDAAGAPLTQTIQTLPAGQAPPPANAPTTQATTATTQTTTTTTPVAPPAQGPVGQPAPTPTAAGGVTPYTYTTVINGVTTAIADNFTPTNPANTPFTATVSGTIWNYSQYLSVFGGTQAGVPGKNAGDQNKAFISLATLACLIMVLMQTLL